ncbi:hypothetical protein MKW92_007726, partial [Papaver armeniacum]
MFFKHDVKVYSRRTNRPSASVGPNADKLQALRSIVQAHPLMFYLMLEELKKQKPNLAEIIEENQDDLICLLLNP